MIARTCLAILLAIMLSACQTQVAQEESTTCVFKEVNYTVEEPFIALEIVKFSTEDNDHVQFGLSNVSKWKNNHFLIYLHNSMSGGQKLSANLTFQRGIEKQFENINNNVAAKQTEIYNFTNGITIAEGETLQVNYWIENERGDYSRFKEEYLAVIQLRNVTKIHDDLVCE